MAGFSKIDGSRDIQPGTISDAGISATAAIAETKILLTFSTASLRTNAVLIDEDRTINEGVRVTFPSTGIKMKDTVNGKTYLLLLQNGVLTTQEV